MIVTVDASEIQLELESRAHNEIDTLARDFLEWVADDPRTTNIVAKLIGSRPGFPDMTAMLQVSIMRNEYIQRRKFTPDPAEAEEIAGQILDAEREGEHDY